MTFDPTLVASDGDHPSAKQYAGWADLVAIAVRRLFRDGPTASPDPVLRTTRRAHRGVAPAIRGRTRRADRVPVDLS